MPETIDSSLATLLALFEGPLASVSFPDVNRATLADLVASVQHAADEVAEARAMLEAAEAALEERQGALLARGQRALAYARIYAESDLELRATLDHLALPRSTSRAEPEPPRESAPAPRKRGRPRKEREGTSLFSPPPVDEAAAAAE